MMAGRLPERGAAEAPLILDSFQLVPSFAGAAWAWLLALLLGAAVLPRLERLLGGDPQATPAGWRLLSWAVVGIAMQSATWLAVGSLEGLSGGRVVAIAAVLSLAAGALGAGAMRRAASEIRERLASARPGAQPLVLLAGFALLFAMVLRLALVPSAYYDDLVYHLGLPSQALLTGAWPTEPWFHYSLMPAGWDASYLLPLALGGGSGPQLMNAGGLLLWFAALVLLARNAGGAGTSAAGIAALLAVSSPVVLSSAALAGNDLFVALALTVALGRVFTGGGGLAGAAIAGLVGGAAWATKYTALPGLAGVALAWWAARPGTHRERGPQAVLLGLVGSACALPWTLRALIVTGNPLFPAFHSVLGGEPWTKTAADILGRDVHGGAFADRGPAAFLFAGWEALRDTSNAGTPSGLNPAFILVAVAGVVLGGALLKRRPLLVALAVAYVGWCMTSIMVRFSLVQLALLAPFAAALAQRAFTAARAARRGWVAWALVLLTLLSTGGEAVDAMRRHLRLYGAELSLLSEPAAEVLPARIHLAAAGRDLDERLPPDARVLMIAEGRLALVPRPVMASSAYDEAVLDPFLEAASSPAELTALLRARGITHVLINERELPRWSERYGFLERLPPGGQALLAAWLREELQPLGRWGSVQVFTLGSPPSQ